ncbi:thioesterase [Enterococcus faecalis]|nr:thioesterase [Enterococcus faecalis]
MPTEMFTKEFLVKESQTAKMLGSGDLEVLGTPALAAMIEQTAKEAVKDQLSVGETTVRTVLELRHLYPSAVGSTIVVTMTNIEQSAHKIRYEFVAYEGERQIAKGFHQRAVVETDSFLKRITKD